MLENPETDQEGNDQTENRQRFRNIGFAYDIARFAPAHHCTTHQIRDPFTDVGFNFGFGNCRKTKFLAHQVCGKRKIADAID